MRRDRFVCRLAFAALDKFDGTATRRTDGEEPQSIHNIDLGSLQDLAPTILLIAFFQLVVLQQPIPNVLCVLLGLALVMLGHTFFYPRPANRTVSHWREHGRRADAQRQSFFGSVLSRFS